MKGNYKRISYAASFGGTKYENPYTARMVSKWLKSFSLITVREEEGIDICQRLGANAYLVPDPTMLLAKEDYLELASPIKQENKPYIFLYLLGKEISIDVKDIFEFAKEQQIEVKYVASQGRTDDYEKLYPIVEEWLALVRDAKYVITNSFHGTVFALNFGKPFLTFPIIGKSEKMNSRIETLLGKYNMKNRIYSGNLNGIFKPLSFDDFDHSIENDRIKVGTLLDNVLNRKPDSSSI